MAEVKITVHGIKQQEPRILRELLAPVTVVYPEDIMVSGMKPEEYNALPSGKFIGLWDTGATGSCITQKVVDALGLKPTGKTTCAHAGGTSIVDTFHVNLHLPNGVGFQCIK